MRAVVFVDVGGLTTRRLIEASLAEDACRPDFEVVGFVTRLPKLARRLSRRERMARIAKARVLAAIGGGGDPIEAGFELATAGGGERPVLLASNGVNSDAFIEQMHREFRPDVLLSFYCLSILKQPMLDSVDQAVNYHDGLLPAYGGIGATSQSIYRGEQTSGFTFHRMTTGIDAGPVLVQGSVPIGPNDRFRDVATKKAEAAAAQMPHLLDLMAAGDGGRPQAGEPSYFSAPEYHAISGIADPGTLSAAEIELRARATPELKLTIAGQSEPVSAIRRGRRPSSMRFQTSDDVAFVAAEIAGVPSWLTATKRRIKGT